MKKIDLIVEKTINDNKATLKIRGIDLSGYIDGIREPNIDTYRKISHIGDIEENMLMLMREKGKRLSKLFESNREDILSIYREDIIITDGKAIGDYIYKLEVEDESITIADFYEY